MSEERIEADAPTAMKNWAAQQRENGCDEIADLLERIANALAIPEADLIQ